MRVEKEKMRMRMEWSQASMGWIWGKNLEMKGKRDDKTNESVASYVCVCH